MNLSKSFEFFDPGTCKDRIHIVGCGSVGSTVAELLARFGLTKFVLYDFDIVKPHNVVNQMFTAEHIGMLKIQALAQMLKAINPEVEITQCEGGWKEGEPLDGFVFLCVDNIELRRKIVEENMYNTFVRGMFDFRTGLTDGQHFAADWHDLAAKKAFLNSMQFSHAEAELNQQMSACNVSLCVAPTVRMVSTVGVTNFINFVKKEHLYKQILIDAFAFKVDPIG